MLSRSRTAVRSVIVGALVVSPLVALAAAAPATAATPVGWDDPDAMSGLDVLVTFVAIPLALITFLVLFGLALARRTTPSYLPYVVSPDMALEGTKHNPEVTSGS